MSDTNKYQWKRAVYDCDRWWESEREAPEHHRVVIKGDSKSFIILYWNHIRINQFIYPFFALFIKRDEIRNACMCGV